MLFAVYLLRYCILCFVNGGRNNLGLVTGMDEVFLGDSHALDDFAGVFMHFFDVWFSKKFR